MADTATLVSAAASAVYAAVSAVSLLLLVRQIGDARRFGAAPALLSLLREMEEHMVAVRASPDDAPPGADRDAVTRFLEFFERVEHLRGAGVLPGDVLARAIGPVLSAHLADPRFRRVIDEDIRQHEEVLLLADHLRRG